MINNSGGVFFYAENTERFLYLLRSDPKNQGNWGIPGGKIEKNETLYEGVKRECIEELNYFPTDAKLIPIQKFINKQFVYHTFFCKIKDEFIPTLNEEHTGWAWISSGQWPKPMHPGLWSTVNFDAVKYKIETMERLVQTSQ